MKAWRHWVMSWKPSTAPRTCLRRSKRYGSIVNAVNGNPRAWATCRANLVSTESPLYPYEYAHIEFCFLLSSDPCSPSSIFDLPSTASPLIAATVQRESNPPDIG